MKKILTTTSRITLLIVLLICLAIKVAHAYAIFKPKQEDIRFYPHYDKNELINELETPNSTPGRVVVSSNILMVWTNEDGTFGSKSFSQQEFSILQDYATRMETETFNALMEIGKTVTNEELIAMAEQAVRLDNQFVKAYTTQR